MKLKILALDLATTTGWAFWDGLHVTSGTMNFAIQKNESPGLRYLLFRVWLDNMIKVNKPDIIVYEMPHMRGHGPTQVLFGFVTRVHEACVNEGETIEYKEYHSGTIKKFATGAGNATKEEMISKAWHVFPEQGIEDDNQADALHILALAVYDIQNELIGDYNV